MICDASTITYPILIQGCSLNVSKFEGMDLHNHVVKMGFSGDAYVMNNLVNMYCVCRHMVDDRKVFNESPMLD